MKRIKTIFVILLFCGGVNSDGPRVYQVIDHHPEHQFEIESVAKTIFEKGRVKLVSLQKSSLSPSVMKRLRPVNISDVRVYAPKKLKRISVESGVREFIDEASQEYFVESLQKLVSFENRSARGLDRESLSGNELAQSWLISQFEEMGFAVEKHCYRKRQVSEECNVVATHPGTSNQSIIVQAHFDDVGHKNAGADDNASGVAALLAMAKAVSTEKFHKTIIFLMNNGEELGLNGSKAYVKKLKAEGRLQSILWTINMDMVAYNQNGLFEIETNKEFESQAQWYAQMAQTYTRLTPEITIPAWGSDHESFLLEGIPSFLTIEDWQTKTPCYHRSCDKIESLNIDYAMEIVRLNLAVVAVQAQININNIEEF